MKKNDIAKALAYIEENLRVSDQTSIEYLDAQGNIERLCLRQNHVIFGRRGSGKSLLLKSLRKKDDFLCININLEDYKDVSFPDSIIQVQLSIIKQLLQVIKAENTWWTMKYWSESRPIIKRLNQHVDTLNNHLDHPDEYDESIKDKSARGTEIKAKTKTPTNSLGSEFRESEERETSKSIKISKLNVLKNGIADIKELFQDSSKLIKKDIFLILDDFYFINKDVQPYFLDFFHRVTKNTPIYLKVATIKHRSILYVQGEGYTGIEIPHDAQELNLDYNLEDFSSMISFMKSLLIHINEKAGVIIDYDQLITPNAFNFLCLASGGVPRDFLSLLISLGPMLESSKSIGKREVIEKSIENLNNNKMASLKRDTSDEESALKHYLKFVVEKIIGERKWNAFLISNADVQNYPQINQAIKELVDLRFLHLANSNISAASSDGTRYSAYLVDIGLFPNSNPRGFRQVLPGQKDEHHREDEIRSAPKLNLVDFSNYIDGLGLSKQLTFFEDP